MQLRGAFLWTLKINVNNAKFYFKSHYHVASFISLLGNGVNMSYFLLQDESQSRQILFHL